MKHLILGSSGQIGSALVRYLKSQGEEVLEFDIKNGFTEDLRLEPNWDLHDLMIESDFVYFLAFDVGGAKYLTTHQDKHPFIDNNMRIMTNTFLMLKRHEKPFVFASSPNYPQSSYGMLKKLGEKMTLDLGGIVTRFWNVYGPEPDGLHSHAITDFIKMAREDGEIRMRTDGKESRQLLYNEDCCEALYQTYLNYHKLQDRILDITTFEWNTIMDAANYVSTFIGEGRIPIIPHSTNRDEQNDERIPSRKTDILNYWQPKTSLKDGIAKMCSTNS